MLELYRYCQGEYVIFDMETTSLNVFDDDIVQIAAIKVKAEKIIVRFYIIMFTDKPIPESLCRHLSRHASLSLPEVV